MAISTYSELQAAIASWLARDDLTSNIPDFITLFEAAAARRLRVRPMETTTTLTPASGTVALPTGYLGYRRLTWTGTDRVDLTYVHPTYLQALYPTTPSDTPAHFTIEGANILIRPTDDTDLEFVYYAKTGALSSALQWLFNNHPDAYLWGSLAEAHGFNIDQANMALWGQRRDQVFDEIEKLNFREPAGMAVRVLGPTP